MDMCNRPGNRKLFPNDKMSTTGLGNGTDGEMSEELGVQGGYLAWRLIMDALAYRCGYREVEWTLAPCCF